MLHYYAQRKSIKDGTIQPTVFKSGERAAMERQFHLFCASAAINETGYEVDAIDWGTIEGGTIERKVWTAPTPEPETPAEGEE